MVETLVEYNNNKNREGYRVKWKHFDETTDEPLLFLLGATDKIRQFLRRTIAHEYLNTNDTVKVSPNIHDLLLVAITGQRVLLKVVLGATCEIVDGFAIRHSPNLIVVRDTRLRFFRISVHAKHRVRCRLEQPGHPLYTFKLEDFTLLDAYI